MSIYEAIGVGLIVYLACAGVAAHVWLLLAGSRRIKERLDIGQLNEDAAVRDFLAVGPLTIERGKR